MQYTIHCVLILELDDVLEGPMDAIGGATPSDSTLQNLESSIRMFSEGIPVLMNALDECAKIHPIIASE